MTDHERLLRYYPGLARTAYRITSPPTDEYNCFAWAAGNTDRWWSPRAFDPFFWPASIPRDTSITSFQAAYAAVGYVLSSDSVFRPGTEKIALYAKSSEDVTHAARQLGVEWWTSKLGRGVDLEHRLHDLEGDMFGRVVAFLERMP